MRRLSPGETQGITVRHDGAERHIVLTATALSPPRSEVRTARLTQAVLMGTQLLSALIGGLIVLRGGRRASVLLIGAAIACNSLSSASPPVWLSSPSIVLLASIVLLLIFSAAAVLFFAFARQFRLETTGKDGPVLRWIWRVLAIVVAAQTGLIVWLNVSNAPYPF
ncbi:MAG: hypothetical protein JF615_13060, partial [Asticcacaulis sp.]|nr:hypothetical protein [Asticcacaulis sp.]